MATLVLSSAGAAAGAALFPGGAAVGGALGALAGAYVDQNFFGEPGRMVEGARLPSDLHVQTSTEGVPISRIAGRVRLAGQVIWATRFRENTHDESVGSKGSSAPQNTQRSYTYSVSFAVALCEGPISHVGRIWADGLPLDTTELTYRVYLGDEEQFTDPVIEATEGSVAPAYRGTAYVVFEDLDLTPFGNRIPQLSFEVGRALDSFCHDIRGVALGFGDTEFGLDPKIQQQVTRGVTILENAHTGTGVSDWSVSLDQLEDSAPRCDAVSLGVPWFGSSLSCGSCRVEPKVQSRTKQTQPDFWSVAGKTRAHAAVVSRHEGRPAFGGTPSDASVVRAIKDLKRRGFRVLFTPMLLMDIPSGNTLTDPWGGALQKAYPWRGEITCTPAPGRSGTVDKTATAAQQVNAFFGTAARSHFRIDKTKILYSGGEWSWRRFVLHYAHLCKAAGGVDAFLLGSQLTALLQVRHSAGRYPGVEQLKTLAADVAQILPQTKLSYGAAHDEYNGYSPPDSSGDFDHHLDPLWGSAHVDFVGIDYYMPLSDWREGASHLDASKGDIYDSAYLKSNVTSGEGYGWRYRNLEDRKAQRRTPITDSVASKPWVFRSKDIAGWWRNRHYNRRNGQEQRTQTPWTPLSKPVWFTQLGCPAVDKGANQPGAPKPYFSTGVRDDFMQRRYLEAVLAAYGKEDSQKNPPSTVYTGPMVDPQNIYVWQWDYRPFPHFPQRLSVWPDGKAWETGFWITGRVVDVSLQKVVEAVAPSALVQASGLRGLLSGLMIDRLSSVRGVLEPLMATFAFDMSEQDGRLVFFHRDGVVRQTFTADDLVQQEGRAPYEIVRKQEADMPVSARATFINADTEYRQSAVEARRLGSQSQSVSVRAVPVVMRAADMQQVAQRWLQEAWVGREEVFLSLPLSTLALDPGDIIRLRLPQRTLHLRIVSIHDGVVRQVRGVVIDPDIYTAERPQLERQTPPPEALARPGVASVYFLDLPLLRGDESPHSPHVAAFSAPWSGGVSVYKSATGNGFVRALDLPTPATIGTTASVLPKGPEGRWDWGAKMRVVLWGGSLASAEKNALLAGANVAAVRRTDGEWEVIQFLNAELVSKNTYLLSGFLRGQGGTETDTDIPIGAPFVLLNGAVRQPSVSALERNVQLHWRSGPSRLPVHNTAYTTQKKAFRGVGLRPLSPVHIYARRQNNSDLKISWVRRTRIGGDDWSVPDVPLGEENEQYEVDVFRANSVVRSLSANTQTVLYTAAQQRHDFTTLPSSVRVKICQISRFFGRGASREAHLYV